MLKLFFILILSIGLVSCTSDKDKKKQVEDHKGNHSAQEKKAGADSPAQMQEGLKLEGAYYVIPGEAMKMAAAYGTITNTTDDIMALKASSAKFFKTLEIHQTIKKGDVTMMEPMESLEIPPGESVQLKPGGMHFMLIEVQEKIPEGTATELAFELNDEKMIKFNFPAQ